MRRKKYYNQFFVRRVSSAAALIILLFLFFPPFSPGESFTRAITRAEMLDALFSELRYARLENPGLPDGVERGHPFAGAIGSSMEYGLIPRTKFPPDEEIDAREALELSISMMGWGFEASLCKSLDRMGFGAAGDPVETLASEMSPAAPGKLITDASAPLTGEGKKSLLSWTRSCKKSARWKRVVSFDGVELMLYRQGVARPGAPNLPRTGNPMDSRRNEPLYIAAVAARPSKIGARIALAGKIGSERAALSEIFYANDAVAAVNGGFFAGNHPVGTTLLCGTHAGRPMKGRPAVGWDNKSEKIAFGDGSARIGIRTPSRYFPLTNFNSPPSRNGVSLCFPGTPGATAMAGEIAHDAIGVIVQNETVVEIWDTAANRGMHGEEMLIVFRGSSRAAAGDLQPGSKARIITDWANPTFARCSNLIQAGPMLTRNGRLISDQGKYRANFLKDRHPRTIMGTDGERFFWAVIDGRSAIHSVGATIEEAGWAAKSMGLETSINLDGGGSSELMTLLGIQESQRP
jgi:exopolysaccharide biosynthesis protein